MLLSMPLRLLKAQILMLVVRFYPQAMVNVAWELMALMRAQDFCMDVIVVV